jgi:hypothetical protein
LDSFMWRSYPGSLRNVGGSTQVPVHAWNNARKDTWGLPPPVKLDCHQMTYTVLVWCKTQTKQTILYQNSICIKASFKKFVCVFGFFSLIIILWLKLHFLTCFSNY